MMLFLTLLKHELWMRRHRLIFLSNSKMTSLRSTSTKTLFPPSLWDSFRPSFQYNFFFPRRALTCCKPFLSVRGSDTVLLLSNFLLQGLQLLTFRHCFWLALESFYKWKKKFLRECITPTVAVDVQVARIIFRIGSALTTSLSCSGLFLVNLLRCHLFSELYFLCLSFVSCSCIVFPNVPLSYFVAWKASLR